MQTAETQLFRAPFYRLVNDSGELAVAIQACIRCEEACFLNAYERLRGDEPGGWADGFRRDLACASSCSMTTRLISALMAVEIHCSHDVDVVSEQLGECARECESAVRSFQSGAQTGFAVEAAKRGRLCMKACLLAASVLGTVRH